MQVYLDDGAGGETRIVAVSGIESLLKHAWALDVVRPPQSERFVEVGLGNDLPREIAITAYAGATGGASGAQAVDALANAAESARWLYVEHGGDAVVAHLAAFLGAGGVQPRGAFSYTIELRWIADAVSRAGPITSDDGADMLTDDGGSYLILWEEEI